MSSIFVLLVEVWCEAIVWLRRLLVVDEWFVISMCSLGLIKHNKLCWPFQWLSPASLWPRRFGCYHNAGHLTTLLWPTIRAMTRLFNFPNLYNLVHDANADNHGHGLYYFSYFFHQLEIAHAASSHHSPTLLYVNIFVLRKNIITLTHILLNLA